MSNGATYRSCRSSTNVPWERWRESSARAATSARCWPDFCSKREPDVASGAAWFWAALCAVFRAGLLVRFSESEERVGARGDRSPAGRAIRAPPRRWETEHATSILASSVARRLTACAIGQSADTPMKLGDVSVTGTLRSRVYVWDWFQAATGENQYAYSGNSAAAELRRETQRLGLGRGVRRSVPARLARHRNRPGSARRARTRVELLLRERQQPEHRDDLPQAALRPIQRTRG